MTTTITPTTATPADVRRTIIGTGIGNAVEWYDWAVYAAFAPFIAAALFSKTDPTSAILSTLAIFAVGFVARPLGGFLFGWIGDRKGRKASMTLAVGLASAGSLLIGIAPTFEAMGAFASMVLLAARLIQGLAHGGELPSSQTYLSEMAPKEKRGYWATLIYVSGTLGNQLGILLGAILAMTLTKDSMMDWGWRVPFLLGAAFGLYALVMRGRMSETETFLNDGATTTRAPIWPQLVQHRKQALQVIGLSIGIAAPYYIWAISAPAYAISALKMESGAAFWAGITANIAFLIALPFWGKLSDKIGRKPVLWLGAGGVAVFHVPMTLLLKDQTWQLTASMAVMLIFIAATAAILPAVYAELFPTSIRTVGVGIPYSISVALFGGTAPLLKEGFGIWFGATTGATLFGAYVILLVIITGICIFTIPETKGKDLRG
jgi:MHS family alpha-ketoglutarate permease-like MFS transporter